jgi:N-methylhydantoinase A
VPRELIAGRDTALIARAFHAEHNRLYGYSLEQENTPVEIINVRVQAIGLTDKPHYRRESWAGADASAAAKGRRKVYIPETNAFKEVPVYDGHRMRFGNRIAGPAMIEQETTAIFVSASYDCVVDAYGSFALYQKGREDLVSTCLEQETEAVT